jgi:hypothetical protein
MENDPAAPTLVKDGPLVEMIQERVSILEGNYFEFKPKTTTIRITIKNIVEHDFPSDIAFIANKEYGHK